MPELTPARVPNSPADAVFSVDFNDLGAMEGMEAVAQAVDAAIHSVAEASARDEKQFVPYVWPEPTMPGTIATPDIPTDILPGAWGAMAQAVADSTQTPTALSVMCCLGVLATLLQRRYEVSPDGTQYTEPLSLWVASVSPSGTRKTAVLGAYHVPILKWEKLQSDRFRTLIARANAARSTAKKRIEALNQQAAKAKEPSELASIRAEIEREELEMPEEVRAPRLFTGNTTAERAEAMLCEQSERISIHSDEPGIFRVMGGAYSGGAQNIDVFLKGHAGSAMRVDRAGRMAHVDKPAVGFNVMLQPGLVSDVAGSKGFKDSGLIARFLWAVPASNVGKRDVRKRSGLPTAVSAAYATAVDALLLDYLCEPGEVPKVQTLGLSEAALDHWLDFSQYIEDRLDPGGEFAAIHDWASKLAGAAARVAALLELARVGLAADMVQFDPMDDAVRLCKLLIPHALAAYGLLGADPIEEDALALLNWARQGGRARFTQSAAKQAMRSRFPSNEKFTSAAERLIELDCIHCSETFDHKSKRGRPSSSTYHVNPALI